MSIYSPVDNFCGSSGHGQPISSSCPPKFYIVVFVGKSQNPFYGEPPRMRTPRHRLASLSDTKEKCSLLFGFARDRFLLKRKGHFSLVFCPPSIRAGGGATILSARAWRNSPHTPPSAMPSLGRTGFLAAASFRTKRDTIRAIESRLPIMPPHGIMGANIGAIRMPRIKPTIPEIIVSCFIYF